MRWRLRLSPGGSRSCGGVVGYEFPLAERLQLTLKTYGEEHSPLDKAPGLRYEIADGLKLSAALGRGNGRAFHQVDLAWEF